MDTNICVKYSFCVEWTMQIPLDSIPRRSPIITLLEDIECILELRAYREDYCLYIEHKQSKKSKVLKQFMVTTFIRDSSYNLSKLFSCSGTISPGVSRKRFSIWINSKEEILKEIPNIFNIGKFTIICLFHSANTDSYNRSSAHVSTQTTLSSVVSVDLQSMSRDFSTFLKDETFSDVKLMCADRTFSANRSVLAARSEVFAAMFRYKMAETEAGVVHIKDTDPYVLELLLKYVYSAEIPHLCEETAHRLYEAADKYAVYGLRQACSDWMVEGQTTDNCLDLLVLGDKHSDENFKEAVACFVAEHLADLSVESWSTFRNNYPLLVLSVLEKRCEDSIPGAAKRGRSGT